jgi:hypothetical protein
VLADQLSKAWRAHSASVPIDRAMRFASHGLVLGADTVLAPAGRDREAAFDEARVAALLAAAHLRMPLPGGMAHLRSAMRKWGVCDDTLASMHLSLSGLDRLSRVSDAQRLFLADRLLDLGLDEGALLKALGFAEVGGSPLGKYSPDQPRVPAGNGRASGEWTIGWPRGQRRPHRLPSNPARQGSRPTGSARQPIGVERRRQAPLHRAARPEPCLSRLR